MRQMENKTMTDMYSCRTLHNGMAIPCMGFGTYKTTLDGTSRILKTAIEEGYRYFDQ